MQVVDGQEKEDRMGQYDDTVGGLATGKASAVAKQEMGSPMESGSHDWDKEEI